MAYCNKKLICFKVEFQLAYSFDTIGVHDLQSYEIESFKL